MTREFYKRKKTKLYESLLFHLQNVPRTVDVPLEASSTTCHSPTMLCWLQKSESNLCSNSIFSVSFPIKGKQCNYSKWTCLFILCSASFPQILILYGAFGLIYGGYWNLDFSDKRYYESVFKMFPVFLSEGRPKIHIFYFQEYI